MALINCPECGKENVSDSAESCPNCGFAIKNYVDEKIKQEKLEKERLEKEIQKQKRFEELSDELNAKLAEIDNMPYPEKPKYFKMLFNGDGSSITKALIIISIVSIILAFMTGVQIFVVIFVLCIVIAFPIWLFINSLDYRMFLDKYNRETEDWEGLKNKRKEELIKYYKNKDEIDQWHERDRRIAAMNQAQNAMKCPVCKSTQIRKISTADRAVSIAVTGLASSKIGKQYECMSCHHKW